MSTDTTIILPQTDRGIITDTAPYWASFYCAILKCVVHQKNLPFSWDNSNSLRDYKGALRESNFFKKMEKNVINHAFEYVMVDFLKTKTGISYFKELCKKILNEQDFKNFNITKMNIFKVGSDSELSFALGKYRGTRVLMLLPNGLKAYRETTDTGLKFKEGLRNSDLLILITDDEETIGFFGEVEGNHGEKLFLNSYYTNTAKDRYCTFGVGVSQKTKHGNNPIKGDITLNRSEAVNRWILHFSQSNYFIKDYRQAVHNIQGLIDGSYTHLEYIEDPGHSKIINILKSNWAKDAIELVSELDLLVDYAFPPGNYYYQETIEDKAFYRPSPLALPDQLPLYSIEDTVDSPIITRL